MKAYLLDFENEKYEKGYEKFYIKHLHLFISLCLRIQK